MRKKIIAIGLVVVLLLTMGTIPVFAANGNGNGNGANDIDVNGFHYTLNILGKKADWNANGDYDHGSTMFVPADSEGQYFLAPDGETLIEGIKIEVGLGSEYAITDGNAFDDGKCAFELPKDKYSVWICMRGKPDPELFATIKGWIYDSDSDISLMEIGSFSVGRKWKDATDDLLYVDLSGIFGAGYEDIYVLDLLDGTISDPLGDPIILDEYFWSLVSNGAKLIKVRIYPD